MQAVHERGTARDDLGSEITKKVEKLLKNLLTRGKRCDIMFEHFRTKRKSGMKKLEKSFEKPLDKRKRL